MRLVSKFDISHYFERTVTVDSFSRDHFFVIFYKLLAMFKGHVPNTRAAQNCITLHYITLRL